MNNREYRTMVQAMTAVRSEEAEAQPSYIVEGYATTFDEPYLLTEIDGEKLFEMIDRHAFDDCDMSDVILQFDHEGRVFARTRNNTLTLNIDDHGLKITADLSSTENTRSLWEDINAGLIDRMSFCFTVDEHEYNSNTNTDVITKIKKLYDTSVVSIPANPFTECSARSLEFYDGEIAKKRADLHAEKAKRAKMQKLRLRAKLLEVTNGH